ncbi:MAG: YgiT-type zinc finger protein [Deltaproteobacteria bacterium]|nr:YgiT-type zinc finger protein [Deltaproteobacteria bacterium]
MAKTYSDCFYCGGFVEQRLPPRELRWQGKLFAIEDVPMGVCSQCGEKFLKPEVAKGIDRIFEEKKQPAKTIQVPLYQYGPVS